MEGIVDRLNNIANYIDRLDDLDQKQFSDLSAKYITNISSELNNLEQIMSSLNIQSDKINEIKIQAQKEKLLMKELFTHYFLLSDKINAMTLDEIENTINNK